MRIQQNCASLKHEYACPLALNPRLTLAARGCYRSEWAVNQHRDSCALYVGFDSLSSYFAVAENEAIGRVKFSSMQAGTAPPPFPPPRPLAPGTPGKPAPPPQLSTPDAGGARAQKMIQPCGPPPPKEEE